MATLKTILTVIFIIISVIITIVVLMQEGKSAGLGAIAGAADSYWGKNKGRSMEGMLVKMTRAGVILFLVLALVLNLGIWDNSSNSDNNAAGTEITAESGTE